VVAAPAVGFACGVAEAAASVPRRQHTERDRQRTATPAAPATRSSKKEEATRLFGRSFASAAWPDSFLRAAPLRVLRASPVGRLTPTGSKPAHRSQRRNGGNRSPQAVPVFLFFSEVFGDPLPVLPGLPSRPVACAGGQCRLRWRTHKPRRRVAPHQHSVTALALGRAETGPATLLDLGGRSRAAQRSGFSPWKQSFCSSG
jgi:hypothetical protein